MSTPRPFGRVLPVSLYATTPAPPIDYLFNDLAFVAGTTGVEHGAGGSGKSMLTLEMCIALALAGEIDDWLGVGPVPRKDGKHWRVVYYTTEDPDAVIHHRIREVAQLWKLTETQRESLATRVSIVSLFGANAPMRVTDETALTQVLDDARGERTRLIVFDTLTRFHSEDENDNTAMAAVIGRFDRIAAATGGGVLVLHHDSKAAVLGGLGNKQQAARGANAITENSRWALGLSGTDVPGVLAATQSKHNYGQESERFFAFTNRGVLSPTSPPAGVPSKGKSRKYSNRGVNDGIY